MAWHGMAWHRIVSPFHPNNKQQTTYEYNLSLFPSPSNPTQPNARQHATQTYLKFLQNSPSSNKAGVEGGAGVGGGGGAHVWVGVVDGSGALFWIVRWVGCLVCVCGYRLELTVGDVCTVEDGLIDR
ncbi:hypothetical protein EYC80_000267 [Monilinia laxa]|uniref:Uncharacterized protein n=1 Tax=Monilinia laxa TaxID=61186 RepID=A0A5N6KA38_MONLA|nr:hypothetical protein EYC80_000267 [Monilinia laxa]